MTEGAFWLEPPSYLCGYWIGAYLIPDSSAEVLMQLVSGQTLTECWCYLFDTYFKMSSKWAQISKIIWETARRQMFHFNRGKKVKVSTFNASHRRSDKHGRMSDGRGVTRDETEQDPILASSQVATELVERVATTTSSTARVAFYAWTERV